MDFNKIKNRYLQISIGLVYVWFGTLKFFPNISPAEELAIDTINELTGFLIPSQISIILLAIWETTVGIFFIFNLQKRITTNVALVHMLLTFTPIYFFPELIFNDHFLSLTLLGQYIFKNLIILGAIGILWLEAKQEITVKENDESSLKQGFRLPKFFGS